MRALVPAIALPVIALPVIALPAICAVLMAPAVGSACAPCNASDPVISVLGESTADAWVVGTAASVTHEQTAGDDRVRSELRVAAGWSPLPDLQFGLGVPVVWTRLDDRTLARWDVVGLGDAELFVRWTAWRVGGSRTDHLHALDLGLGWGIPTATSPANNPEQPTPTEALPGAAAWSGSMSLAWRWRSDTWSGRIGLRGELAGEGRSTLRPGALLLADSHAQWQPIPWLALRAGLALRTAQHDQERGLDDPHSGGTLLAAVPGVVFQLNPAVSLHLSAELAAVNALHGQQANPLRVALALQVLP